MSWQAYVDSSLVGSGNVDKGAIMSVDGKSVWAISPGFTISPSEMDVICAILSATNTTKVDVSQQINAPSKNASKQTNAPSTDDPKQKVIKNAQENGFYLNNERFVVVKTEERSLYGRKKREGICAVKTKQAIIVGHYNETQQAGNCNMAVQGLADYLIGQGY